MVAVSVASKSPTLWQFSASNARIKLPSLYPDIDKARKDTMSDVGSRQRCLRNYRQRVGVTQPIVSLIAMLTTEVFLSVSISFFHCYICVLVMIINTMRIYSIEI